MKIIKCLLLILIPMSVWGDIPKDYKEVMQRYNFPPESYSFVVKNLTNKDKSPVIYNQEKLFNPASVAKIITTFIALNDLGPSFKWKSDIYYTGEVVKGKLLGNLIFQGRGDATFSLTDLEKMIRKIQKNGIQVIEGDLIFDRSYFASVRQVKYFDNELMRAYNALPNPIVIQSNTINFKFLLKDSQLAIESSPELKNLTIKNLLTLNNNKCVGWKSQLDYRKVSHNQKDTIIFNGKYSKRCFNKEIDLSVIDNSKYFYQVFKDLWERNGGQFHGVYQETYLHDSNAELITSHFSEPLSELIRDINKFSLNLMSRNLLLTVIAEQGNIPVIEPMINSFVRNWLNKNNINTKGFIFDNGAGLSRKALLSTQQLLTFMEMIYSHPLMPEMIASFPIVSVDGTLEKRMPYSSVRENGHFKTGSLKHVNAIAGYFVDQSMDKKIFIFIMNDPKANQSQLLQQELINLSFQSSY